MSVAEQIEAPARIRPTHRQDRTLSVVAGAAKGFSSKDWPVEVAYEAGRLECAAKGGMWRWVAIRDYRDLIDLGEIRSGRDSTQGDVVSGGGGYPISEARADAIKKIVSIDSLMPRKDRTIVRKLCEGYSLAGAVREACGDDFVHTVTARVRDALDALIQAMRGAKRAGYTFDLRGL